MAYQKRLKKEYEELSLRAPIGIALDTETMEDNIDMYVSSQYPPRLLPNLPLSKNNYTIRGEEGLEYWKLLGHMYLWCVG